jgi:DNA-binding CsgD family transcriptional regulator
MSEIEEFSTLIGLIYESVETPEVWQPTLKAIGRFLSVKDVSLGSHDLSTGRFEAFHLPIDPDFVRSYAEFWGQRNFLWKASSKLPVGQLFSFETAMPRDEFSRTGLYNEWFKPQGMDKALGANLLVEGPLSATVSVFRPAWKGDFSDYDIARFRALLPHLERVMRLRAILNAALPRANDLDAVLASIEKPAILVDHQALFLHANTLGAATIRDGGLILGSRGALVARSVGETKNLHKHIYAAATKSEPTAGHKMVVHREDAATLILVICPLPGARYGVKDRIAIVYVDDPGSKLASPGSMKLLQDQFGLTRSEASLVVSLLSGATLRSSATQQDITVQTARTHLAHIFQKTGTHSQSELMRLLARAGHCG